jgi:hypothetical protein
LQSQFKLLPAVAPERVKDVAGEALRMNPYERRFGLDVAKHEGDGCFRPAGFGIMVRAFETQNAEVTELGREIGFSTLGCRGTHNPDYIGRACQR